MSHFTKCALKMTNLAAIKKALADLQHQFTEAEEGQSVTVRGYRGDTLKAAISVNMVVRVDEAAATSSPATAPPRARISITWKGCASALTARSSCLTNT